MTVTLKDHPKYHISPQGEVFGPKGKLKLTPNRFGYLTFSVGEKQASGKWKIKTKIVHRVVAENFISNPMGLREVNHINGDKSDNRVENLEWVTSSQNRTHAIQNNLAHVGSRAVIQMSINGELIKEYESITEAAKSNDICVTGISSVANGRLETYKGFKWKFKLLKEKG